ncbi:hypothetical protein L873DRAFT_1789421 [Choiromyces venosus 120613-1]|uniref:Uncharacterized protein n=1 Tax=Choiromyces venosus 120613-1 TaxID=1336337 RepID=A0A3N4JNE8_9PEZI|nr:hypothetical protein L873DRAFT_1789421 [Choiromyces venosus 120613-1]
MPNPPNGKSESAWSEPSAKADYHQRIRWNQSTESYEKDRLRATLISLVLALVRDTSHQWQHAREPTPEQHYGQKLLSEALINLQKVVSGDVTETCYKATITVDTECITCCFTDTSTMTTNECVLLDEWLQQLESKVDQFLNKPSYVTILQHNPHQEKQAVKEHIAPSPVPKQVALEDT